MAKIFHNGSKRLFWAIWTGVMCTGFLSFQLGAGVQNGNFELGDLTGWIVNGEVSVASNGTDATTGNHLQRVAEGKYSAMIGDEVPWSGSGIQQSSLEQVIQLPQSLPSDSVLEFVYAVVANDPPDHPEIDKPRFRVLVDDLTSNKKLLDTEYLYTSQSSKDWYLGDDVSGPVWNQPYYMLASDRWVFRPWNQVSIPITKLSGHQIKIYFEVRDCNYGAHAIYGLLDGVQIGSPTTIDLPDLEGDPQPAVYLDPPFWWPILLFLEKQGLILLCCIIPLLLFCLLLWWLLKRKKHPEPDISYVNPVSEKSDKPADKLKGGIRKKLKDE